jgi:hypothetical protein
LPPRPFSKMKKFILVALAALALVAMTEAKPWIQGVGKINRQTGLRGNLVCLALPIIKTFGAAF